VAQLFSLGRQRETIFKYFFGGVNMAKILKNADREFKEDANKIDNFRLYSDTSRIKNGVRPTNLNFDLRLLNPGQFSAPFHFHRFAEELFIVLSGSMTLRTFDGIEIVETGDVIF
jgi:quercetin dioxygenase-like cupin family protein